MPEGFFRNNIFLTAILAKTALNNGSAIKAILLLSLGNMGHDKFFLKIGTKTYNALFLLRY